MVKKSIKLIGNRTNYNLQKQPFQCFLKRNINFLSVTLAGTENFSF